MLLSLFSALFARLLFPDSFCSECWKRVDWEGGGLLFALETTRTTQTTRRKFENNPLPNAINSRISRNHKNHKMKHVKATPAWAAANGGVTNGGLRGVWPPFLEIGRNWPFSPFFCLFRPFPEGAKSAWEIQKTEEKGLFPQISSDLLKPPSLKPPFAALQPAPKESFSVLRFWEKNLQGPKSWACLPKFCRTLGVLSEGSSAGSLLCKRFRRTRLQNPRGSADFWGGGVGSRAHFLRTGIFPAKFRKVFQPEIGACRGLARVLKSPSNP